MEFDVCILLSHLGAYGWTEDEVVVLVQPEVRAVVEVFAYAVGVELFAVDGDNLCSRCLRSCESEHASDDYE